MSKKVVIIGGVAGGASAAARLRRLDESAEIIMFEKGKYISFANCGLPYYIGGAIEERSALLLQTPKAMSDRFNIDVRIESEVTSIDKENKKISILNHTDNSTYEESYDTLVLSPGSMPIIPPIKGIDSPNIFSLWNIPDVDKIKTYVDENKPKRALVIGGGFIGLEMAENLHDLGIEVSVVEMAKQVMAPIDFEMAQIIHKHMVSKNVNLILDDGVKEFNSTDQVTTVVLNSGRTVEADMVILSIGIKAQSKLAIDAGLATNKRGGIIVDEYLKSSDENIYAIGDAIEITDFVTKEKAMIPLAGPANKQGRMCADNIAGRKLRYNGTQGTSVAKIFDMTVSATGVNEKTLNRNGKIYGKDYYTILVHPKSHAGYYPGAMPMTLKVIFDMKGLVLGSQNVGYTGVEKRIDVIATAMRFGATVLDLKELELSYAPPYSSAKDPVNMAGYVGENILTKTMLPFQYHEVKDIDFETSILVDVRTKSEVSLGAIKGHINIPVDDLRNRLDELDKNKTIIIYCAVGIRGHVASRILMENGFTEVKNLIGGYTTYSTVFGKENTAKDKFDCNGY